MRVLVTGAAGQLGFDVTECLRRRGSECFGTGSAELDITDGETVRRIVADYRPDVVINCAAYTNVDGAEKDEPRCRAVNAEGAANVAAACARSGCRLIHISTDYVFPGDVCERPLIEFDTPAPKSMYGVTKLAGEQFVRDFSDHFFIIRTAWLYGDGHNFAKTMLKLSETNDTIGVVMDQVGTPTSATELAKAIKYLLPTDNYGLFHGTCEGDTNWAEFAKTVLRLAGKNTEIEPITSQEYKRRFPASADRPAYSILENYMLKLTTDYTFASWQDAIEAYMKELIS